MKVERTVLHNFLSYHDADWSPDGARLATIVGNNGAGKSTLASDALLYTLYDAARGRTDDLVRLGQTDMAATVEFSLDGARYRVTRGRTAKAGGKSFLELAIAQPDGSWSPLTGETIADTEAAIERLLRLDAAAFRSAVLLAQGQAMAFAQARDSERKAILGTVLDLGVYAAASARARELARDLEARAAVERAQLERLDAALAAKPAVEHDLEAARGVLQTADTVLQSERQARDAQESALRELAGRLAELEAARADVARLRGELEALRIRYTRARDRQEGANQAAARANEVLANVADVDAAAAALDAALERHRALQRDAAQDLHLKDSIDVKQRELADLTAAHQQALGEHRVRVASATRRVEDLTAGVAALQPVICTKCGTANVVDQAGLRAALEAAAAELASLGAEPAEPTRFARERGVLGHLESRRRELHFDPVEAIDVQTGIMALTHRAAQAGAIAGARATLDEANAALAAASIELAEIDAAGKAARANLEGARAVVDAGAVLVAEEQTRRDDLAAVASRIVGLEQQRTEVTGQVGRVEERLAELERTAAQRETVATAIALDELALGRLRRLVVAFGDTGIPARIIESALPELEGHANELLAALRPGMSLAIRSGRVKKDGSGVIDKLDLVVRDAAGERPLALFSGGERMSVSLALAVGLSRLVARRAGTAIHSLVIDEPDGLDAESRRAFGQALRVLAHRGELERVVLVSHHADLAEFGDATYQVTKSGSGSVVTQVA